MKEGSSLCEGAIDRNWVLKRKRKRTTSVVGPSNGKEDSSVPQNAPSAKSKLKHDIQTSRFANKIKGQDGYYFECVECDLGGNLLCCDSCPRTYHLECLNPPLKSTPSGKWQCPRCSEEEGNMNLLDNSEANSKRARTKRLFKNKTTEKVSTPSKVSTHSRGSMLGSNKSSHKGKAPLPTIALPNEKKPDSSLDDSPSSPKSPQSSNRGPGDDKLISVENAKGKKIGLLFRLKRKSTKEGPSLIKISESGPLGKSLEEKVKRESDVKAKTKSRKKKQKANRLDKKRSGTKKWKYLATTASSDSSKEAPSSPDYSELVQKGRSLDKRSSMAMAKYEKKKLKYTNHKQPETSPQCAPSSPQQLNEKLMVGDMTMKHYENLCDGIQQVDRILGCRMQTNSVVDSSRAHIVNSISEQVMVEHNSASSEGLLPSFEFETSQSQGVLPDDHLEGQQFSPLKDGKGELVDGCSQDAHTCDDKPVGNNVKSCPRNECLHEDTVIPSVIEHSKERHYIPNCSDILEDAITATNVRDRTGANTVTEKRDAETFAAKINDKSCTSRSCNLEDICIENAGTQPDEAAVNRAPTAVMEESTSKDQAVVTYEFLVKWLGKSNIHNSWVSEAELKIIAKRKLENYKAKYGLALINICKEQWTQPQRIIGLRSFMDGKKEVLVKWCSLPYDECTWEKLDEPVVEKSAHLVTQFKNFESQTLDKDIRDGFPKVQGDSQELGSLVEQPKELQGGTLFPHQLEALNWLRKCWYRTKNVILADEMGLGKTVSACAFISSLYCEFKVKLPCLVLVPLSTMPNWLAEFASWAPHLNAVEYHGSAKARSVIRQHEWHANNPTKVGKTTTSYKFEVLLTTYEMVLADASQLRAVSWEVLIVDEGHRLKNSGSKLFSLLNTFSFQHRVLLTGTPLQNNIGEMYNLLNFLQPISFPSLSAFEEKFNDLTTSEKVEELKKLVAPHMLRRLKKEAMQNIPPKTERMVPVELTSIQAEYYRAMLTKNYQVIRNIGKGGAQQSLLNIVMQLRKVCNHPYLIPGTEPESGSLEFLHEMRIKASAKLTLLHSMLKILHRDGHRVLIFSQMTKLLDILEDYLAIEFGPKTFERVDGSVSVSDRQAAIACFNQDKSRFVFLLSTRSCGLGINLATADTVIIYDSDFNPHADIQAMNRAHRIGQSRRLLVYRLVVRASVEERILQLAKKKLMLDQLFVNKSESQKEVEDILRWGTEELFSGIGGTNGQDSKDACSSKNDVVETEHKNRRRSGGLGDVYEDKLAPSSSKIVWDENAIAKLLDRSNLQSSISEATDGDLENDLLGTVKSMEWNDELNEEPGVTEVLPSVAGDGGEQPSELKDDSAVNGIEENEWDRLLRVRWEQYQAEEEAALGRGKRLRKAVSYRETFTSIPSEALSESDDEDEPEPVYSVAGRAFKEKYAKLRARQKERIAQRPAGNFSSSVGRLEELVQPLIQTIKEEGDLDAGKGLEETRTESSFLNRGDSEFPQVSEDSKLGRLSKHGYKRRHDAHADLNGHQLQSSGVSSTMASHNLLPVLGLCAPNAPQVNSSRNYRTPLSLKEQRRTNSMTIDLPLPVPPIPNSSSEQINEGHAMAHRSLLPDVPEEALQARLKNMFPDNYFPFCPIPPPTYSPAQNSGSSFASFQEKLGLPSVPLGDNITSRNLKPPMDTFPNLSLGTNRGFVTNQIQDMPNIPPLPNFAQHLSDTLKQKQHIPELPPMLGLGHIQSTHSSMPENHKKVLDNIMMRTQSMPSKFLKKRPKTDAWSEDELDALWIGVRRHGRGNWDVMLRDPKLKFSSCRTVEDLSTRWTEEQCKIFEEPKSADPKSSMPATFPGISDAMMNRALHGSKFSRLRTEPPKRQPHLTDIRLGFSNFMSGFPRFEPANIASTVNEVGPSLATWQDKHRPIYAGEYSAGTSHKFGKSDIGLVPTFHHASFRGENFGSMGASGANSAVLQLNEMGLIAGMSFAVPNLLDKPLNLLQEQMNNVQSSEILETELNSKNQCQVSNVDNSGGAGSSKINKLPHWLQEAVSVPQSRPLAPDLPPTVSAIAQSVRLVYGEQKPALPPFNVPGPLFRPKDPRESMKKRRKFQKIQQVTHEVRNSEKTPGHDGGSNDRLPPLNLNLNPPSSSIFATQGKKSDLLPSPGQEEVLPSLASSAVPESCTSFRDSESPALEDHEGLQQDGITIERQTASSSLAACSEKLKDKETADVVSGDLSEPRSNPMRGKQPGIEKTSSEELISDDHHSEDQW